MQYRPPGGNLRRDYRHEDFGGPWGVVAGAIVGGILGSIGGEELVGKVFGK